VVRCFPAALAAVSFLCLADVASAARPIAGARYTGVASDNTAWAELDVSRSGRSLTRRGSSVELVFANCGRPERREVFRLRTRRRPVRIGRRGRFAFALRRGRFVLRVSGRFSSRSVLRIAFRYRRSPVRASEPCDDSGRYRLTLRRVRRGRSAGCGQRGRTLAWAPSARVFQRARQTGDQYVPFINYAYGCLFSRRRAFLLDEDQRPDSNLRLFRLAGPYTAYAQDACPMGCGRNVFVVDLRNGRKLLNRPTGVLAGPYFAPATDLELKANASVAWMVEGAVLAHDSSGERRLDSGDGIDSTSLELEGSRLTWIKNGVVRSAILR
jgi:hypothetical protein